MFTLPTKKRMTELARQARRYGYSQYTEWSGGVRCPQCHTEVSAHRYNGTTWPKALDTAMLAHLPACSVLLAVRDGVDVSHIGYAALSDALDLAPLNSDVSRTLRTAYDAAVAS